MKSKLDLLATIAIVATTARVMFWYEEQTCSGNFLI